MLTIFSIPKPFFGHTGVIQRNAIQSWLKLDPSCEIFLCGNDQGVRETALEFNVKHFPDIEKNEYGTPLLSSAFKLVKQESSESLLCYVNSDIIILNSVIDAVRIVPFNNYLLLGQRWNLDLEDPVDFSNPSWEEVLRRKIENFGKIQPPLGSDFFIFPKTITWELPEFAVGRPMWDNWLIYRARVLQIPVIDATSSVTVIHQNHNYNHIPNGINPMSYEGPEAIQNRKLVGGEEHIYNLRDATHQIIGNTVQKALSFPYMQSRLQRQPVLSGTIGQFAKLRWRLLTALLYRRRFFPKCFWQNIIYSSTK